MTCMIPLKSKGMKYVVSCQKPNGENLDGNQRVEGADFSYSKKEQCS